MHAWAVGEDVASLVPADFDPLIAEKEAITFALLGTGARMKLPPKAIIALFAAAKLGLEVMDTGAAVRTYNILLAEGRAIAAALLPAF